MFFSILRFANKRSVAAILMVALSAFTFCSTSDADVVLKNDSITAPGAGTPLPVFLPGEQAAVWLTAPSNGTIVGVQVFWDSLFGPNPPQMETAIHVYAGGTFPTPGPLLASVIAPVFSDGTINQFNFLDPPSNNTPMQIAVSSGQNFVVSVEFLNQSSGNLFASGIEYDMGCQPGRNSVMAIPGGWVDACSAGVPGDLGIRAIHRPIPEPGVPIWLMVSMVLFRLRANRRN